MDRIEQAKQLRKEGLTYAEIGGRLGVSGTMGRNYTIGNTSANNRQSQRENAPYTCNHTRPRYSETCQRVAGHEGIHLSSETGKLLWW